MPRPLSPVPGWGPPQRGLFVDLWGTLLELPSLGWTRRLAEARFTPGAVDALFLAAQAQWNIYLVGNASQVAFGEQPIDEWKAFQSDLSNALRAGGVPIARDYTCPHHPDGKAPQDKDSVYLLPNTGAMYHAAQTDGVSLRDSVIVGDSTVELAAGWRAGLKVAGVRTGLAVRDGEFHVDPDAFGDNLAEIVRELAARTRVAA